MKTLRIVNQVGPRFDKETALLAEAGTLASQTSHVDLNCAAPTLCTAGADDGSADCTAYIVDGIPEALGAAAYHYTDPKTGKPAMRIDHGAMANGEWLRDPSGDGDSGVGLFLHEFFETQADELANLFVAGPWSHNGVLYTLRCNECCDPVQGITGTLELSDGTVVDLPDYVYPNVYFGPTTPGTRFDREGALTEAGQIAPQGYQIAAGISNEQDVFAHVVSGSMGVSPRAMARKKAKGSRTTMRLEQIANALGIKDVSKISWV